MKNINLVDPVILSLRIDRIYMINRKIFCLVHPVILSKTK